MTIPRFDTIDLGASSAPADAEEQWDDLIEQVPSYSQGWQTPEHILVPPVFGESALDGLDFLQTYPGIPPFLRGPYALLAR